MYTVIVRYGKVLIKVLEELLSSLFSTEVDTAFIPSLLPECLLLFDDDNDDDEASSSAIVFDVAAILTNSGTAFSY